MTAPLAYAPRQTSRSRHVDLGELRCHLREWGPAEGPAVILLHGVRDASVSFQFVVDRLPAGTRIIAPDWRGHGLSDWTTGHYWQTDLLADLDRLFTLLALPEPPLLVAHSMGGNAAALYAGLRPDRIRGLILLDALGNPLSRSPVRLADLLTDFLDGRTVVKQGRPFASQADLAARLMQGNPRLDAPRAQFLAAERARPLPGGGFTWQHDPNLMRSWPSAHSVEELAQCWGRITVPVACLLSSDPRADSPTHDDAVVAQRVAAFPRITVARLPDTGHNLHIDAPEEVARLIESFGL